MKVMFSRKPLYPQNPEEDFTPTSLQDSIEKTRQALENAYAGFDSVLEADLIDSYIYEINSLQKRYKHLTELAAKEPVLSEQSLGVHSPIRTLFCHVFRQRRLTVSQARINRL